MNSVCPGWTLTSAGGKDTPKENQTAKNQFRNSESLGSLEDSNNDCFSTKKR